MTFHLSYKKLFPGSQESGGVCCQDKVLIMKGVGGGEWGEGKADEL